MRLRSDGPNSRVLREDVLTVTSRWIKSCLLYTSISLPALMQLMGHSDIETTMHYVQVTPQDVYLQYARAAAQCIHPQPRIPS